MTGEERLKSRYGNRHKIAAPFPPVPRPIEKSHGFVRYPELSKDEADQREKDCREGKLPF